MTTVFISYSRANLEKVKTLVQDLNALGHQSWFDQELAGGQSWWDHITLKIRECELFVYVISVESLDSRACRSEYSYASKLGKNFLPVLVGKGVDIELLPPGLASIHYVDYRAEDKAALGAIAKAIATLPPSTSMPDPLPDPPPVPVSYLSNLIEQINTTEQLSFQEQTGIVLLLKHGLSDPKDVDRIISLLKKLRSRNDLFAKVAEEIDMLLRESFSTTNDAENILHSSTTFTSSPKDRKRSDADTETKKSTSEDDFVTKFLLHFRDLQSLYKRLDETDKFEKNVMTVMGCFVIYLWGWFFSAVIIAKVNDSLAIFLSILSFSCLILGIARSIAIMNFGGIAKFTPGVIYGGISFGSFVIWLFFLSDSMSIFLTSLSSIVLAVSSVVVLKLYRDRFFQK